MRLFAKSPTEMRREAERGERSKSPPPGPVDPSRLPPLFSETGRELDAAREWLAHVQAGRIEVK